jgi:hypothetical protein
MLCYLLFLSSLIFLMNYYYAYFDVVAMWIKNNSVVISCVIFIGSIFISWVRKKNYYYPNAITLSKNNLDNKNRYLINRQINYIRNNKNRKLIKQANKLY